MSNTMQNVHGVVEFDILEDAIGKIHDIANGNSAEPARIAKDILTQFGTLEYVSRPTTAAFKNWMQQHHTETIHTVQVHNTTKTHWMPTYRTVDASRSTYVELSSSRRDYGRMQAVAISPSAIVVRDGWHTVLYTVAD